jgi:hypothetical protein
VSAAEGFRQLCAKRRVYLSFCTALLIAVAVMVACSDGEGPKSARGILHEVSQLPNPFNSPYADCLQVAHVRDIVDWPKHLPAPPEDGVLIAWPGFLDRRPTEAANLVAGDAVSIQPVLMEEADEKLLTMQRADSVSAFDLPLYLAGEVGHIRDFRYPRRSIRSDVIENAVEPPSLAEVLAMPVTRRDVAGRSELLRREMGEIELAAARHGGWKPWDAELRPLYVHLLEKSRADAGIRRGDMFFHRTYNGQFSLLVEREEPASLKMLVALDRELAQKGIDLLVVPFPFKEEITADLFADPEFVPQDGVLSPGRMRALHWLMEHDVEVVDLVPALHAQRESRPWLYYDFEDMHPAQDGIDLAAGVIGERLSRYRWPRKYRDLQRVEVEFEMPEQFHDRFHHLTIGKKYPARQVVQKNGEFLPPRIKDSPLLLIGDSFTRVPALYGVDGAALREQLGFETGILPRELSIKGSAAQMMRNLRREGPGYLDGVEVCVFVFAQYPMLTETDPADGEVGLQFRWEIVPLP